MRAPLIFAVLGCSLLQGCASPCGPGTESVDGVCMMSPHATEVECGPDTTEQNGICVPASPAVECGPDTTEQNGICVPSYPQIECGPNTTEVGGHCVVDSGLGSCGPGTIQRGDTCVATAVQVVQLPFKTGTIIGVSQGFHGDASHHDADRYAVDFPTDEGTEVVAARSGRVWRTYNDSTENCRGPGCSAQANYVIIDHGDVTFGRYWHLQYQGVQVAEGQHVCKGQVIALSGNTGHSTGPHLHFDIIDPFLQTLPVAFEELTFQEGTPVTGGQYTSQNADLGTCSDVFEYSSCPQDLFKHMGIILDSEVPCSAAEFGAVYPVTGKLLLPGQMVRIATVVQKPGDAQPQWHALCYPADSNGNFSAVLSWSPDEVVGNSWLMISAANANCNFFQGWLVSPVITFQ